MPSYPSSNLVRYVFLILILTDLKLRGVNWLAQSQQIEGVRIGAPLLLKPPDSYITPFWKFYAVTCKQFGQRREVPGPILVIQRHLWIILSWQDGASVLKGEPLDQVVSIVAFLVELFHGFCGASNTLSVSLTSVFRSLQKMTQTSLRRSWPLRLSRRLVADVSGLYVSSAHDTLC